MREHVRKSHTGNEDIRRFRGKRVMGETERNAAQGYYEE